MPCVSSLMSRGLWGTLRSSTPPITMPAWACMVSGRDPGELGIYGFRNRIPGTRALRMATADDVRVPRVWDVLGAAGRRSSVLYVPPTWPPRPISGELVGCMLTPGPEAPHTHPPELAAELSRFGPHTPDVVRVGADPGALVEALIEASSQHFDVAEHLLTTRKPDFAMMVEMGTDRLHHAMWPALDPSDPRHDPRSPLVRDARDVYAHIDARIGRLLERLGPDTTVMVVSDHGARPLRGGMYVNEWLRQHGWLVLRTEPRAPCALEHADVDWGRTRAWAEGGYHARITLNVKGLFPDGCIEPASLEAETLALAEALAAADDGTSRPLGSRVVRPRNAYRALEGTPPDLLFFPGDLDFRALGEVGTGTVFVGPDEAGASRGNDGCNHDWEGLFVLAGPDVPKGGSRRGAGLHDVGVTALRLSGVPVPDGWLGQDLRELGA